MKYFYFPVVVILYIIILSGCGFLSPETKESTKEIPRKFGATYMTMNNPYFEVLNDSIKEVVEANGDILITRDPAQDQEKQNLQVLDMIEEGVDAIFINPADWKDVEPALNACQEAGIPVFNVDTYVYNMEYVVSTIISDNYNAGVQCAKDVMSKKTHAKIVVLNHPNMNSIIDRVNGFINTIGQNENYEIVRIESAGAELEIAMEIMDQIIDSGVEFDVVMGGNDPTALGALAALQLNNIDKNILIYGVDGSPDGKVMIQEGLLEGSSAQRPITIGRTAAEVAYSYFNGNEVDKKIVVPVTLITKENLDEFDITGWQ